MTSEAVLKCLCWSFLLLWANEKIFYLNAAGIMVQENLVRTRDNNLNFIKPLERVVQRQQPAAAKTQTFLELILGIVDTCSLVNAKLERQLK